MTGNDVWIIPARAGFTANEVTSTFALKDHPRSRGVYFKIYSWNGTFEGSSPLARGLRGRGRRRMRSGRIIPARAGFTDRRRLGRLPLPDHPRSRGVYLGFQLESGTLSGSSPLARGLPPATSTTSSTCRIIPARAGFTGFNGAIGAVGQDHPRSRGVYRCPFRARASARGSSPLARGLPFKELRGKTIERIIPARAGFTAIKRFLRFVRMDHPRSRGVYEETTSKAGNAMGSSPLARGLHRRNNHGSDLRRIIPARAGFTSPSRRRP